MTTPDLDLDWLISVDDHILEPPDLWTGRASAADRDRVPRMVTEDKSEFWTYDGKKYPTWRGCYDPVARIADVNQSGVLASLCFPAITRFCGQLFAEGSDRELGMRCLSAYNDWLIEDWCGAAPGRYIPLVLIPLRAGCRGDRRPVRLSGRDACGCTRRPADSARPSPTAVRGSALGSTREAPT